MEWAAVDVGTEQQRLSTAASKLEQQLCVGEHPWHTAAGYPAGPQGALRQRMGMVALDLRAAGQEQKLVLHEMHNFLISYEEEEAELQQIIAAAAARACILMQEQSALIEQLDAPGGPGQQQRDLWCRIASLSREQRALLGKQVLLRKRCLRVQQLLDDARRRFDRYISTDQQQQQQLTAEQLAQVADDEVRQQEEDGAGVDEEDVDEADAVMWQEEAAAAPATGVAADEAAGTDAASAPGLSTPQPNQQPPAATGLSTETPAEMWRFWWSEQVGRTPMSCYDRVACGTDGTCCCLLICCVFGRRTAGHAMAGYAGHAGALQRHAATVPACNAC